LESDCVSLPARIITFAKCGRDFEETSSPPPLFKRQVRNLFFGVFFFFFFFFPVFVFFFFFFFSSSLDFQLLSPSLYREIFQVRSPFPLFPFWKLQ